MTDISHIKAENCRFDKFVVLGSVDESDYSKFTYMDCGIVCDAYGCWNKCRRPDGHSGEHQCDQHGG